MKKLALKERTNYSPPNEGAVNSRVSHTYPSTNGEHALDDTFVYDGTSEAGEGKGTAASRVVSSKPTKAAKIGSAQPLRKSGKPSVDDIGILGDSTVRNTSPARKR